MPKSLLLPNKSRDFFDTLRSVKNNGFSPIFFTLPRG